MNRTAQTLLVLAVMATGYILGVISWCGYVNFGVFINTVMFCSCPILVIGGIVFLIARKKG
jgi:uncharacterized membrane protein